MSSRSVLDWFSFSRLSSFLMRFQVLSQNSICSRLIKLSLLMDNFRQMEFILFY